MKAMLAIVGAIATGVVLWLRWYLSDKKQLEREFENNEDERIEFMFDIGSGNLADARKQWMHKVRENRAKRKQ